jgi:hypothetical protein
MTRLAAWGVVAGALAVAALHILLALGAPLGAFAWGGAHAVLPIALRGASLAAALYLFATAGVVLLRAGVLAWRPGQRVAVWWTWLLVAQMALNTAGNLVSMSPPERLVMARVTAVLTGLLLILALSPKPRPAGEA